MDEKEEGCGHSHCKYITLRKEALTVQVKTRVNYYLKQVLELFRNSLSQSNTKDKKKRNIAGEKS